MDRTAEALAQRVDDPVRHQALLQCAFESNRVGDAAQHLSALIARDPGKPILYQTLAYTLRMLHRTTDEIAAWRMALQIHPAQEGAAYELAGTLAEAGRGQEALRVLSAFVGASGERSSPPRIETLDRMAAVVQGYVAKIAPDVKRLNDADRKALVDLLRELMMQWSMADMPVLYPDQAKRRLVKPPNLPAVISIGRLYELVGERGLLVDFYQAGGLRLASQLNSAGTATWFEEAMKLVDRDRTPLRYFSVAGNLAHAYTNVGRYAEADSLYAETIARQDEMLRLPPGSGADRLRLQQLSARNLHNASALSWKRGRIAQSLERLYRAEQFYRDLPTDPKELLQFNDLLVLHSDWIDRYLALNQPDQARKTSARLAAFVSGRPGVAMLMPELKAEQLEFELRILVHELESRDNSSRGPAAEALKAAQLKLDEFRNAQNAVAPFARRPSQPFRALRPDFLALKVLAARGDGPALRRDAMAFFQRLGQAERAADSSVRSYRVETMILIIDSYLADGILDDVDSLIRFVEQQLDEVDAYNWRSDMLLLKARWFDLRKQDDKAEQSYREMVRYLSDLRGQMPISDDLFQSEQRTATAYGHYIRFLTSRQRFEDALAVFESARTQTLVRSLQLRTAVTASDAAASEVVELQRTAWERFALTREMVGAGGPSDAAAVQQRLEAVERQYRSLFERVAGRMLLPSRQLPLREVLTQIARVPGEVIVFRMEPEVSTLTTWRLRSGRLAAAESRRVDWPRLRRQLAAFSDSSASLAVVEGEPADAETTATELAQALLPWLGQPGAPTHVTLVPDQHLQDLPFAALETKGQPIIVDAVAAIGYAPSLTVLGHLQRSDANARPTAGLFVGYRGDAKGFTALDYTEPDAKEMAERYRKLGHTAQVLTPPQKIDPGTLASASTGRGLVVIGTHGVMDTANPLTGYLLLPQGQVVQAFEFFNWKLAGARVILSACQVGRDVAGTNQDILGVTFPLLAAGARATLHAQWSVPQESTSSLVKAVVDGVGRGQSLEEALVNAQRAYLRNAPYPLLRHPTHWAAWRVLGYGS